MDAPILQRRNFGFNMDSLRLIQVASRGGQSFQRPALHYCANITSGCHLTSVCMVGWGVRNNRGTTQNDIFPLH